MSSFTTVQKGLACLAVLPLLVRSVTKLIHLPSLRRARKYNDSYKFSPKDPPVAIFVGGTSGIARAMAESFARITNGHAHIVIVGRNASAAKEIIAGFPKPIIPGVEHEFVQCDLTYMRNVQQLTSGLLSRFTKIDYLVLSTASITSLESKPILTDEGMDIRTTAAYYARWKILYDLTPRLRETKAPNVYLVGGAGMKHKMGVHWDDLGLTKNFSILAMREALIIYHDSMAEDFSEHIPNATLIHAYPGFVRTGILSHVNVWWFRIIAFIMTWFQPGYSANESGEYMLYGMLKYSGGGVHRIGPQAKVIKPAPRLTKEQKQKIWDHSKEMTTVKS